MLSIIKTNPDGSKIAQVEGPVNSSWIKPGETFYVPAPGELKAKANEAFALMALGKGMTVEAIQQEYGIDLSGKSEGR